MNTDWLNTFRLVARLGSFTKAGEHLFMSQPGVSAQVRQLEQAFGTELLVRKGQRVSLTEAGHAVLHLAEQFEEIVAEARMAIEQNSDGLRPVTIASPPTVATYTLPSLLAEFCHALPGVGVTVQAMSIDEAAERVLEGTTDFGVIAGRHFSDELMVEPLYIARLWLIAPSDHPLADLPVVQPEAIQSYPILLQGPGMESHKQAKLWAATHGVGLRVVMEAPSHDALIQAVKLGLGLAFSSGVKVSDEVAAGHIAVLRIPETPIRFPLYLAHRSEVHSPVHARMMALARSGKWRSHLADVPV